MYIPPENAIKDKQKVLAFMQAYSFATIINCKDNYPYATHLPFVVKEVEGQLKLTAHFAKANEQWKLLKKTSSLVVFQAPHAYISPQHYDKVQNVPTWNYVAVHAYGQAEVITDETQGFAILEELIQANEPAYQQQWSSLSQTYKEAMYQGIVPFILPVSQLEAKAKLSQNKKTTERIRIAKTLSSSVHETERIIGNMMKE